MPQILGDHGSMGRMRRPNTPGGIFHIAARTIRGERLFTPAVRSAAIELLPVVVPRSEVRLLGVAIMSTHLHLVLQQGRRRVDTLMQPYLCRLALRLQRAHDMEGPMFWRPYLCEPCHDPRHARNAIVYVHLNAVRAGICREPDRYPWTSHELYTPGGTTTAPDLASKLATVLDPTVALPLFATGPDRSMDHLRGDYLDLVRWRIERDRAGVVELGPDGQPVDPMQQAPPRPVSAWGDRAWGPLISPLFHSAVRGEPAAGGDRIPRHAPDLATIARNTLAGEAPGLTLMGIRGRGGGPEIVRLRNLVIQRIHAAGYPNTQIAAFLGLSESAVWYHLNVWKKPA